MNQNHYAVIMAGGIGSRFWPMSRTAYPKQFLDILNTGKTLLQSTYERFLGFIPNENIFVVTSADYTSLVMSQLPDLPAENILGEPERKNTAPCIALISMKLILQNPNANLIVAPSDHLIENETAFRENCLDALQFTEKENALVTLGIKPTHANTGYGYIQFKEQTFNGTIRQVARFTEKPDKKTALSFVQDGSYLWNAGIFIWKAADILNAFEKYAPQVFHLFKTGEMAMNTPFEKKAISHIFSICPSISIDYAIMEKAPNVFVIPATFEWSDLGTWNSAWENFDKDAGQNAVAGENTLLVDANGCIVHSSDKKLILVGGVDNLIIVNTKDALLVCKKENEQQIKDYVKKLQENTGDIYL